MHHSTESFMFIDPVSTYIIFAICMAGCSYCAYKCGEKEGIVGTLNYLEAEGVIDFEED
tara:strand:+ start:241 stop:417 length:177 start_codon:yes stop_codon:yes gene_type:complete